MSSTLLFRWAAQNTADGTLFYPPEGRLVAGIHVRERIRPLESTRDIVRMAIGQLAHSVQVTNTGRTEMVVTAEGEYAAYVEVEGTGRATGRVMHYVIAFVFGDDFYDRIDGYFSEGQGFQYQALMKAYIVAYRLQLGELRARRFYYDPPPNWQGRARNLLAQWFTYDFPKRPSQIIVSAAFPSTKVEASVTARSLIQRRLVGFKQKHESSEPLGVGMALHHVIGSFASDPSITDLCTVVATDQRFIYVARLETSTAWLEEDRATLLALAQSIRWIPTQNVAEDSDLSWMAE